MFAHQVIDSLQNVKFEFYGINERVLRLGISGSNKFHLSSIEGLNEFTQANVKKFLNTNETMQTVLSKDLCINNRFPFDECWFDWVQEREVDGLRRIVKYGCWMHVLEKEKNGYPVQCFRFDTSRKGEWVFRRMVYEVNPDKVTRTKRSEFMDYEEFRQEQHESLYCLYVIRSVLLLLSCKNIGTEKQEPPVALNKKRQKAGKQPLFTYHTLVLKPFGKHQESIPRDLWNNRIHLMRGHFKTYTEEKPLFGHIIGRFWWQPCVRGRNKRGVVMKDYEVMVPEKKTMSEELKFKKIIRAGGLNERDI
jgi:hypothetical protein